MTGIASALKSRFPHTGPARVRARVWGLRARASTNPHRARVCRRERVPALPGERFNFDHFARPCARLNHTAAVNYQGSIALTRKAPIRCQRAFVCTRACHSIVDEVWLPSTGARLCAVNAPFPQSGSARRSYQGSILTVHHLLFNCGKESMRACQQCGEINPWSIYTYSEPPCSYLHLQSVAEKQQDNFSWGCVVVSDTGTGRQTSEAALIPSEKNMMSH